MPDRKNAGFPRNGKADLKALLDGRVAEEDSKDARWVKFEKGYHELVVQVEYLLLKRNKDMETILSINIYKRIFLI